ncbi:MAG: hypothetical protein IPL57_08160 [Rubrivivax sp.]|nr:hypothetical protein [Rubrivivax sp.]
MEVFPGNTADPATVAAQVAEVARRFGIEHIVWASDRGMLTSARIEQLLKPQGMVGLAAFARRRSFSLAAEHGPFQPSLFDERNLLELTSEHFPGERGGVPQSRWLRSVRAAAGAACRHRGRSGKNRRHHAALAAHCVASRPSPARGAHHRALPHGQALRAVDHGIRPELATPAGGHCPGGRAGRPVRIRTSVSAHELDAPAAVAAYKSLSHVERAFRSIKTVDMQVRPVFHYSAQRARMCSCACWPTTSRHMRQRLKPMLFDDEYLDQPASRASPVLGVVQHAKARMPARPLTTACRCTASERCCRTWARWPNASHIRG